MYRFPAKIYTNSVPRTLPSPGSWEVHPRLSSVPKTIQLPSVLPVSVPLFYTLVFDSRPASLQRRDVRDFYLLLRPLSRSVYVDRVDGCPLGADLVSYGVLGPCPSLRDPRLPGRSHSF